MILLKKRFFRKKTKNSIFVFQESFLVELDLFDQQQLTDAIFWLLADFHRNEWNEVPVKCFHYKFHFFGAWSIVWCWAQCQIRRLLIWSPMAIKNSFEIYLINNFDLFSTYKSLSRFWPCIWLPVVNQLQKKFLNFPNIWECSLEML